MSLEDQKHEVYLHLYTTTRVDVMELLDLVDMLFLGYNLEKKEVSENE